MLDKERYCASMPSRLGVGHGAGILTLYKLSHLIEEEEGRGKRMMMMMMMMMMV
jgi:hypothetical protein